MNYTFTNEDVKYVEKAVEIKNRGFYIDGAELTTVYNRVLHKNATPTSCGSCLRQRVGELEQALNHFKSKIASESVSEPQVDNTPQEENNAAVDAGKDAVRERMAKVRAARKQKKNVSEVS